MKLILILHISVDCPPGSFTLNKKSGCIFPHYLSSNGTTKQNRTTQQYCDAFSSHVPVVKTRREASILLKKLNSLMVGLKLVKFFSLTHVLIKYDNCCWVLLFQLKHLPFQSPYYKTENDVALNNNFAFELSGNAMSIKWKPRTSIEDDVISFTDGQGTFSSTYFNFDDLRNKGDRRPHIVLDSYLTSLATSYHPMNLRFVLKMCPKIFY